MIECPPGYRLVDGVCLLEITITPGSEDNAISDQHRQAVMLDELMARGQGAQPGSYLPGLLGLMPQWLKRFIDDLSARFNLDWRLILAVLAALVFLIIAAILGR